MQMVDKMNLTGKGRILAVHFDPVTGRHVPVNERYNIITYEAADIMARLVGGEKYAPQYMGFVYGPIASPPPPIPTDREQTWDSMVGDISGLGGNIILVPLSNAVSYAVEGDPSRYSGNAITFNAFADETIPRTLTGGAFENAQPTVGSDNYYQAALISAVVTQGSVIPAYRVVARMSLLDTGAGVAVDATFKLAVYWTIAFK